MMVPFGNEGPPQQGQPSVAPQSMQRPPMPHGHVQAPSPVMPPMHHGGGMNHPPYGHRGAGGMPPGQPYSMPPSPAARQGSFGPGTSGQYSSHPHGHSPHGPPGGPMHPSMPHSQMHRNNSMGRHGSNMGPGPGMPPMPNQHGDMRPTSSGGMRQQQYGMGSSGGMISGNWQSDRDTPHRREMIQHIVKLLKKDKHNSSPESMQKLPQMAKQLEVSLYRNARSFDAYMDMSTLKHRLQQIAYEVSRKTPRMNNEPPREDKPPMDRSQQPPFPGQNGMRNDIGGSTSPFMGNSSGRMVNMDEINPIAGSGGGAQGYGGGPGRPGMSDRMNQSTGRGSSSMSMTNGSQSRNDPEWKVRIRHKQQRLLLLHHSAKCHFEDGRCTVTPHCADMKRLWRHMEGCKDNQCQFPHCFSSRAILSHYRKCKDSNCPACGPVRETVRKGRPGSSRSQPSSNGQMRGMPGQAASMPQQQQQQMPGPSDPLGISTGSFGSSTSIGGSTMNPQHTQRPPSSHAAMPPPTVSSNPSGGGGMQFPNGQSNGHSSQSHFHPNSNGSGNQVQPMYRSDQQKSEGRASGSRSNELSTSPMPSSSSRSGSRNDSEWQKIRHKQQRLLLLRHASRCQHESGKCPVTPHCASMKKLWEHIAHCKNQQCTVQHCLSSRYVLSHYRRCKDARCPACAPVRETIKKSHEREKIRQQASGTPSFDTERIAAPNDGDGTVMSTSNSLSAPLETFEPEPKRQKHDHEPEPAKLEVRSAPEPMVQASAPPEPEQPVLSEAAAPPPPPVPEVSQSDARTAAQPPIAVPSNAPSQEVPSKPTGDHSLLNSFSVKQLETHLASLDRKTQLPQAQLKSKCLEVLKGLQTHQHGWVFNCPVDPVELGLPDYFEIIKKPMDLGTIQKRLESNFIHSIEAFAADVHLTFDNAMTYNENASVVYDMAKELKEKFENDMKKLMGQLEAEDQQRRQNERACTLCGSEKLLFEPPVYFCNGMNCQSQRIRRNSHFYIGGNNQYFWCSSCYNELDEKIPIELVDMTIMKSDLKKKKNDEVHEESWVQCDTCERWVHQVCGLFNTRQNKEHHSEYCCPKCLLQKRTSTEITPSQRPAGAADLPRTTLSEWLEQHIAKKVAARKRKLAESKAQTENISMEEALMQVESGGPIIIRQVTAMDRKHEVRELMQKRYAHKNYPEEFPFRCKCILVFQELDGVDVVLFALYLYEHGQDNPPPNQRCVYISYLDSVHFMRPRRVRTFVYHEILIAYLDYARRRGFATAHIWACPPLKGDDYIFYAKPEDQKTPRDNRLRQWYIDMLIECQRRSIVGRVTNMYDLYFADESLDATAVPYLEGDYFPGEAENIIKMLQEGGGKKGGAGGKKKKSKSSAKNKGNTGTRSTGVDEEALIASGMYDGVRNFKELDRDQVMVKLGETIQPMKESFIVAFLNWSGAKEEDLVVPESVEKARLEYAGNEDGELAGSKRDAIGSVRDIPTPVDSSGRPIKVIDDDTEDLDCEFLNNRQAFLNLCRGNHYQFDELRRAKHTSMMVLWHLHNRDAPTFVKQCVGCSREILSGKRYHCNTCPDYDLCQECYRGPNSNRGSCTHELQAIAVEPDENGDSNRSGLTEAERQQRQRNLMLHIQLIEHASRCNNKNCSSTNCAKMKSYLLHSRQCKVKVQGGCKICKRIWTLLRIHAQKCKDSQCPIPQCNAIREKMRQLKKQQEAMDDRRRNEMNRHRFGSAGN